MRPNKYEHNMRLAFITAQRATCARRKVGCILVNERFQVIGTGYNGPPAGMEHCITSPCEGANYPSGQGLDKCVAVHAEQNALLQCPNVYSIYAAFVTASPCVICTKLLMNTSCRRIYFVDEYPHSEAKDLWTAHDGEWIQLDKPTLRY